MKYLKIILVLTLIFTLCACSKSEFVNISAFIDDYCAHTQKDELKFEDFRFTYSEDSTDYFTYIDEDTSNVLLTLTADKKSNIVSCRIMISKIDDEGKTKAVTEEDSACFLSILKTTICSFCQFSSEKAEEIAKEFYLYNSETYSKLGELTKDEGNFHIVYYSTPLSSEMRITNTLLKEVKPTQKPESKPYFAEATSIRTETVPLR